MSGFDHDAIAGRLGRLDPPLPDARRGWVFQEIIARCSAMAAGSGLGGGLGGGMIHHNIPDKDTLYKSYMPFVKNGGLFIPGHTHLPLGREIFLTLTLMGSPERLAVAGKVVWVTPKGAQSGKVAGIGVQFGH